MSNHNEHNKSPFSGWVEGGGLFPTDPEYQATFSYRNARAKLPSPNLLKEVQQLAQSSRNNLIEAVDRQIKNYFRQKMQWEVDVVDYAPNDAEIARYAKSNGFAVYPNSPSSFKLVDLCDRREGNCCTVICEVKEPVSYLYPHLA